MIKTTILGLCIALNILSATFAQSQANSGDQSGTLVITAITATSAIVAVDSKISPTNGRPSYTDTSRKILKVGDHSSCALNRDLGIKGTDSDVVVALSKFVTNSPHVEADDAVPLLMLAAQYAFMSRRIKSASEVGIDFNVGNVFLEVSCGGYSHSKPFLSSAYLWLDRELQAHIEYPPANMLGEPINLAGELPTSVLLNALSPARFYRYST
jgi:hypothetical protein